MEMIFNPTDDVEVATFGRFVLAEAASLLHAERCGVDISDCLEMSPQLKKALELFVKTFPNESYWVNNAIEFREHVNKAVIELRTKSPVELEDVLRLDTRLDTESEP